MKNKLRLYKFLARKLRPIELAVFIKTLLRIKRRSIKTQHGVFYIDPVSDFGLSLIEKNDYDPNLTKVLNDTLKEGDTFIDIGANEGFFSVVASGLVGKKGKVVSVEPQQRLWEIMIKNFENNNCTNCIVAPYALGEQKSTQRMNLYPSLNSGASTLFSNFSFKTKLFSLRKHIYGSQILKITTLDSLVNDYNLATIKLIKIDIEGYEFFALKGGIEILKMKMVKNIFVEFHPYILKSLNQTEQEIINFITSFGYKQNPFVKGLYSL